MNGSGALGNCARAAVRSPPCSSTGKAWRGDMTFELALCALLIEALVGYPDRLFRAIGHPVVWIGALIANLDRRLNRASMSEIARRSAGMTAILIVAGLSAILAYAV